MAELGSTTDPKALVPGDVSALTLSAYRLGDYSTSLESAGTGLKRISTEDGWRGAAADAFRSRYDGQPRRWIEAADCFGEAHRGVDRYASTLSWAQGQAQTAIDLYAKGERATEQAKKAYQQARTTAEQRAREQEQATGAPVTPAYPTWSDPGEADRQQARHLLDSARTELRSEAERVAAVIDRAAAPAPQEPTFWDKVGSGLSDFGQWVWGGVQDGAIATVNGLASFGNAMLHHPDETLMMLGGLMMMVEGGGGEVGGLALDATGAGAVVGVPINIAAGGLIVAGAGLATAGAGGLAQNAAGADRVEILESRAQPSGPGAAGRRGTPTDRAKEHLTERDLGAARRELNGEVVARKPNGEPWNHVQEVRETQNKLINRIRELQRMMGDTRLSAEAKAEAQSELSEASRLLDHSKQFVPRP